MLNDVQENQAAINMYLFQSKLAKQPPSAAFPSPSGSAAVGGDKKKIGAPRRLIWGRGKKKKIGVPAAPQVVLSLPQGHEGSEYMLSFEIGQREGGFYSGRTDGQTDTQTDTQKHPVPYSNIDSLDYKVHARYNTIIFSVKYN